MSQVIRITKEFTFEMSHVLPGYDGPCRNVHGHSYRLFVTVAGIPVNNALNPKNGMVMDFSDMKKIVMNEILGIFDHAVAIPGDMDREKTETLKKMFGNTIVVDYQPTCKNLVTDFAMRIKNQLPADVKLYSLKLYETATSFAEWFSSDNE
jgi:6-pyruvoyltetrahydropterin/6-carboxytetrahydropterin synthase